ncbi:wax ester/triacylglycerol synthase domain-containing protein [Nonomuraea insulae]|uniref:diacylglycerol O-acyltransferase n=1 Tax=Nonomuraea insulae TaxID=1616787 RepID=A0ABW1CX80_9ACTN
MRQLTALDAQFLNVETATTAAHVAGLALLDPADGAVNRDALAELLLDRLHLSPALSLRLAEVPLGLDHPYWAADPGFDIDNHLFEMTLPAPGDDWQLAEAVADLHARRLDRTHPLWEMHLINGLAEGKVAVYTKVHHAAIDGISGAETLATLLDLTPDGHLTRRRIPTTTQRSDLTVTTATPSGAHTHQAHTAHRADGDHEANTARQTDAAHGMDGGHPANGDHPRTDAGRLANGDDPRADSGHPTTSGDPRTDNERPTTGRDPRADNERPANGDDRRTDAGHPTTSGDPRADNERPANGDDRRTDSGQPANGEYQFDSAAGYEDAPGLMGMLAGAAVRTATHPVRAIQSVVRAAGDLDAIPVVGSLPGAKLIAKAARVVARDQHHRPELPSLAVPRTPLNGPISARRHLSFGSVSLKDVKNVAKANGMSVNDVVMTLCTSALRSWLRERDALPETPLIVAVPVAVRKSKAKDVVGNQISAMVTPMPTNVPDPMERLQAVGAAMERAKRRFALAPATWLSELCSVLPAPVTSLATPAIFRLAGLAFPPINLIISNVPGPQFPLYLCGGRVLSYYPLSVLTDMSGGVNITCFSYDGMLDFGIVACPERMDDVWGLLAHLRTALDELLDERVGDEFRDGVRVDLVAG